MNRLFGFSILFFSCISLFAQDRKMSNAEYQKMLADSSERMLQRYYQQNPDLLQKIKDDASNDVDTLRQQDEGFEDFMIFDMVEQKNQDRINRKDPDLKHIYEVENEPEIPVVEIEEKPDSVVQEVVEEKPVKEKKEKKEKKSKNKKDEEDVQEEFDPLKQYDINAPQEIEAEAEGGEVEKASSGLTEEEKLIQAIEERKKKRKWLELERARKIKEARERGEELDEETINSLNRRIQELSPEEFEQQVDEFKDEMYQVQKRDTAHRRMVSINDTMRMIRGVHDLPKEVRKMGAYLFAAIQDEEGFGMNASNIVYSKSQMKLLREEAGLDTLTYEQFAKNVNQYRYMVKSQCDKIRYAGKHLGFDWFMVELKGIDFNLKGEYASMVLQLEYDGVFYYIDVKGVHVHFNEWNLGKNAKITFSGSESHQNIGKEIRNTVYEAIKNNSYDDLHEANLLTVDDFKLLAKRTGKKNFNKEDLVTVRNQYIAALISKVQEYHRIGLFEDINWETTKIVQTNFVLEGRKTVAMGVLNFKLEDDRGNTYRVMLKDLNLLDGQIKIGNKLVVIDLSPQVLLARKLTKALQNQDSVSMFIRNVPIFVELEYLMQTEGAHIVPGEVDQNLMEGRLDLIIDLQQQMKELLDFGNEEGIQWSNVRLDENTIGARFTEVNDRVRAMYMSFYLKHNDAVIEVNVDNCVVLNGVGKILSGISFNKL